ncbi:MAG: PstS family phosphate ABC transporter substrate-binding protein [Coraliomargaritaceae bacterium]
MRIYNPLTFFCAAQVFCFLTVPLVSSGEPLRFAISDLLAETLTPQLEFSVEEQDEEVSTDKEQDADISIVSMGSLPALERLRTGNIDLAVMAFPEGAEVPRSEFSIYPFAYAVSIIAVNENNPLDEISLSRLAGIYGTGEAYNFTTWGDLGLSGWGSRKIKPLSGHTDDSIALELFKYSVLVGGSLKPAVDIVREEEVIRLLENDPASVAILSRVPQESSAKILLLSKNDTAPAYGPTNDNIHFGDYPVRLTFYVVGPKSKSNKIGEILRNLWSDEIADQLAAEGIFALPKTVREKLIIDLDLD